MRASIPCVSFVAFLVWATACAELSRAADADPAARSAPSGMPAAAGAEQPATQSPANLAQRSSMSAESSNHQAYRSLAFKSRQFSSNFA